MNKIYRVIWNFSSKVWVAVSELGKGKTKSSSSRLIVNERSCLILFIGASLYGMAGESQAQNINGYTDFTSSASITDGLTWTTTATVQVDAGAIVTVSNPSGSSTLNMGSPNGGDTSLWMNGGTLTATNSGSLLMGNNSMLQIGGAKLGD